VRPVFRSVSQVEKIPPIIETFLATARPADECWIWTGALDTFGYGFVNYQSTGCRGQTKTHRFVYALLVGDIPEGLTLDHLCRVRNCVNPDHLEPVSQQINLLRGDTIAASNAAKTHCPRGHALVGDNLVPTGLRKARRCRICARQALRSWREAHREKS